MLGVQLHANSHKYFKVMDGGLLMKNVTQSISIGMNINSDSQICFYGGERNSQFYDRTGSHPASLLDRLLGLKFGRKFVLLGSINSYAFEIAC